MNFLIIGDPIRNLKSKTDSSLAIAREALQRTYSVHWTTADDIFLWEGRVFVRAEEITGCAVGALPSTETVQEPQAINSYDCVMIRKDPPFDNSYLSLCWLLALEENNVPMINKPSALLRYHEKMLPLEALERGFLRADEVIPTFLPTGKRIPVPSNFPKGEAVIKPWLGHGGKDVERHPSPKSPEPYFLLQPLQKEVQKTGDRRIFVLDGEIIGSFVRLPPEGEIKSNIASGGKGILKDMTPQEKDTAMRAADFLKEIGITLAGMDMINGKISEINITSPTGFLTYHEIGGSRLAPLVVNLAESLV